MSLGKATESNTSDLYVCMHIRIWEMTENVLGHSIDAWLCRLVCLRGDGLFARFRV